MKWSIDKRVDGVITDDPRLFLKICRGRNDDGSHGKVSSSGKSITTIRRKMRLYAEVAWIQLLAFIFGVFLLRNGKFFSGKR